MKQFCKNNWLIKSTAIFLLDISTSVQFSYRPILFEHKSANHERGTWIKVLISSGQSTYKNWNFFFEDHEILYPYTALMLCLHVHLFTVGIFLWSSRGSMLLIHWSIHNHFQMQPNLLDFWSCICYGRKKPWVVILNSVL